MKYPTLEKVLKEYAEQFKLKYIEHLNSNEYGNKFRIIDTIQTEVQVLGDTYRVVLKLADYWHYIEEGRKAGKQPPPDKLISWIRHNNIKPRDGIMSEESLAYLIGRKIGQEGIKPRRWLAQTQNEMQGFRDKIITAFQKDIKEYTEGIMMELKK